MCTIILGVRIQDDELPWTIVANRDERLDRPSAPPRVLEEGGRRILMPQDLVYGGTWIGMNDHGLLVALTNRDDSGEHHGNRSRGLLVSDALRLRYSSDAAALAANTAAQYKPFHLVTVDRSGSAELVIHGDDATRHERLDRGWHVITEQSFGAGDDRRGVYLRERIAAWPHKTRGYPADLATMPGLLDHRVPIAGMGVPALAELLGTHLPGDPFDGPCVHTVHRDHPYGTRSFFAAEFDPWMHDVLPEGLRWWSHEGPACTLVPSALGNGTMFGANPSHEPPPPLPTLGPGQVAPPPNVKGRKTEEGGIP
ncbi:MAG: NRDE family protein [bacterium]|nr:NRDE family protein [bacterium]